MSNFSTFWNRGRVAYCTSLLKKRTFAFRRFKSCRFLQSRERHQKVWGGSSVVRAGFLSRVRSKRVVPQHTLLGSKDVEPKLEGYRLLIAGSLVRIQPAPPVFLAFGFYLCEAVAEWLNATVVREHQPSSATCSILKLEPID